MAFSVKPAPAPVISKNTFLHLVLNDTTAAAEVEEVKNLLLFFFFCFGYHVDLSYWLKDNFTNRVFKWLFTH